MTAAATRRVRRQREHAPMSMHEVTVSAVQRLSAHMVRITFAGPTLSEFIDDGPDQRFKLLLPRGEQQRPVVPAMPDWYANWSEMPPSERAVMRTYTIRHARPELGEVDVDFVLHGDNGPASAFAGRARMGDQVALFAAYAEYDPQPTADWQLIVGDDTALPAVAAILERHPADQRALVFLEVDDVADQLPLTHGEQVTVRWLHRSGRTGYGEPMAAAVREAAFPPGEPYCWVAGESSAVKTIRRHLVKDRGVAKDCIMFMGYWRSDGPIDMD